jgi:CelD/BcsL family acetyltransferase involved in cellulose biosynthesis
LPCVFDGKCCILYGSPLSLDNESLKPVRVTVLKEIPEDPDLSAAWNTLVLAMDNPEVFLTYQWALAASRGFQNRLTPLLFLMYEYDQLAGVVALAIDPNAPRAAFFLTSSTADYCDIVSAPANRRAVILALLEEIQKLGLRDLVLANVPATSATLQELPHAAGPSRFYVTSRTAYKCGVVQLEGDEQRETILQNIAGKGRERRALKKLTNLGAVKVIHLTEPGQIGASLESIVSAQISRFLASNRVSPLVGPERRRFLRHLSDLLSHSGWLKISQLEIDGRPVAWNYGFRFGGSWFWYLPTFQMEYEHVSPGSCLLRLLVEEGARDTSLRWLDLGLGDEPYKERFANNVRQTQYVRLSRGFPKHAVSVSRGILSSAAARFPQFGNRFRDARGFCQATASRAREAGIGKMAGQLIRKALRSFASRDEVLLFEAPAGQVPDRISLQLSPLTREHLVEASILNAEDSHTLRYLMRCAKRLSKPGASGFLLQDHEGRPVHFLWIDNYNGFRLSEIEHSLDASSPAAAMIFDCWTPTAERGRGHYAAAIRQAAATLQREGRTAWIFSGASNVSSLRGILKAGFDYRFSLVRRMTLGRSAVTRRDTTTAISIPARHRMSPQPVSKSSADVASGTH